MLVAVAEFDDTAPLLFAESCRGDTPNSTGRRIPSFWVAAEILGLPIQTRRVKPVGIMKTRSGTITFVVLAVVAIVVVITFRAFAQPTQPGKKFVLNIGRTGQDYLDVDKPRFDEELKKLESHGGQYEIGFKHDDGHVTDPYHALNIKIDKVTTSKVAQNAAAGKSAANDPNVVHLLRSDNATDVKNVLATFK
jgi:hypothetical protein